jgi:hypothetical protein
MKQFQSTTEGTWVELLPVQLTEEQKTLLRSREESDRESQKELREWIKSQREGDVLEVVSTELKSFYNSVKPELKEGDIYHLIAVNVSENFKGILNCRVNGEHKQIRF